MKGRAQIIYRASVILGFFAMIALEKYPLFAAALGSSIYLIWSAFGLYRAWVKRKVEMLAELVAITIGYGFLLILLSPQLPISADNLFQAVFALISIHGISYMILGESPRQESL